MCYTGARQNLGGPGSSKTHISALSGEIHTEQPVGDYRCYPVQRNCAGGYQPFASALFTICLKITSLAGLFCRIWPFYGLIWAYMGFYGLMWPNFLFFFFKKGPAHALLFQQVTQ